MFNQTGTPTANDMINFRTSTSGLGVYDDNKPTPETNHVTETATIRYITQSYPDGISLQPIEIMIASNEIVLKARNVKVSLLVTKSNIRLKHP